MVTCTPCLGLGVRHIQYFLFAFLIFLEYWLQVFTMKVFLYNAHVGRTGDYHPRMLTAEQVAQSEIVGYLTFSIGRLVSGFACMKMSNKYMLIGITVFEVPLASVCYEFTSNLPFFLILTAIAMLGFARAFHWTLTMNILSKWTPGNEFTTANVIIVVTRDFLAFTFFYYERTVSLSTSKKIMLACLIGYTIWIVLFLIFGADGPDTSFFISKTEYNHLAKSLGHRKRIKCSSKFPLKSIFKTLILYGWVIGDFGRECAVKTITDGFPLALAHAEVTSVAGVQVGIIIAYTSIIVSAVLTDKLLITKEILTPGQVRKIYSSVGCCGASISMILAAYTTNPSSRLSYLVLGLLFGCIMNIGLPVVLFDLSPNYAATLFSIFTCMRLVLIAGRIFFDSAMGYYPMTTIELLYSNFYRYGFLVFMTNLLFLLCGDIVKKPFDSYDTVDWTKESIISYP